MAKARKVIADQNSAEFDALRRSVHAILVVLQNVAGAVDAGDITADEAFTVLYTTISAGLDADIALVDGGLNNYAGTNIAVEGIHPTPKHPRRPNVGAVADIDQNDL